MAAGRPGSPAGSGLAANFEADFIMVKLLGCALALLVSATQLPPKEGKIESLKDSKANFASFTTYRWEKAYEAYDKNIHKLIVDTIDAELAARGFKKVEDNS